MPTTSARGARRCTIVRAAPTFTGLVDPTATRVTEANEDAMLDESPAEVGAQASRLPPHAPRDMLGSMTPPLELSAPITHHVRRERHPFAFVAERLWLDFVNTDTGARSTDPLHDFGRLAHWLEAAHVFDAERTSAMQRRAMQQPAGALAGLGDAPRVRAGVRGP